MPLTSYYQRLGLTSSASLTDVKKAYRKLAFKYHPDHNGHNDAEKQFVLIQEAYNIITEYIATGKRPKTSQELSVEAFWAQAKREAEQRQRARRKRPTPSDLKKAYEKKKKEKEQKDQELYNAVYHKFCNSWRITYVKSLSILLLFVACSIVYDMLALPYAEMTKASCQEFFIDNSGGFVDIDGTSYRVSPEIYYATMNSLPLIIYRTPLYGDISAIRATSPQDAINYPASMVTYGAFTVFLFLIPSLIFFYKKPSFNFTFFFIHYSMYVAPSLLCYFMVSDFRIIRLLSNIHLW